MNRVNTLKKGLLGGAGALALMAFAQSASAEETLTFVWHAGTCADAIVDIAKDYPDKNVKIVPALVPYGPEWHNKIASEFAIKGDGFFVGLLTVGQFLGLFVFFLLFNDRLLGALGFRVMREEVPIEAAKRNAADDGDKEVDFFHWLKGVSEWRGL